jgi:hypothetical protein
VPPRRKSAAVVGWRKTAGVVVIGIEERETERRLNLESLCRPRHQSAVSSSPRPATPPCSPSTYRTAQSSGFALETSLRQEEGVAPHQSYSTGGAVREFLAGGAPSFQYRHATSSGFIGTESGVSGLLCCLTWIRRGWMLAPPPWAIAASGSRLGR